MSIVNGIDVPALRETMSAIAANPAKGLVSFNVLTSWAGQTRSESRVKPLHLGGTAYDRDFVIAADEPAQLLGKNSAPNPQELLMAALNACMMVGYVTAAAAANVTLTKLEIETTGEQFDAIHQSVIRLSPNRFNIAMPIRLEAKLVVES
jgi:organic hydroperoxide reductase OsmC/OhrA